MTQHRVYQLCSRLVKIASVAVLLLWATITRGDIFIDWPELVVLSGPMTAASGFADIIISLNNANFPDFSSPLSVTSHNLQFHVTSGTGLTFAAPVNALVNPLFSDTNFNAFGTYPSTTVKAADDGNIVTLADGKGLIRVPFTVAAGHVGETYTIAIDRPQTQLALNDDASVLNQHLAVAGGSITVQPAAVPEPAAVIGMSAEQLFRRLVRLCSGAGKYI
jgi:hypothetical protein